ncbi:cyclic lactone autoinducer peptide [Anaeromicropila populeti]|uniref:Cyclic lactone autoinducer peptide n=1 Tax=Anaeromicropila populeti TaxID=37658 RepID=A0A1I6JH26_9FIRM|nr:cyclic lactone autoinducer peptide [Anaeromicropila populeti]SFR78164.1 cyclic lactone autoinducer peptide [Anaeromicropila populeti]
MNLQKKRNERTIQFAETILKANVNTACLFWFHQPKIPEGLTKKFKKH